MISDAQLHKYLLGEVLMRKPYSPGYTAYGKVGGEVEVDGEKFQIAVPLQHYAFRLGYLSRVAAYDHKKLCGLNCHRHYHHEFRLTRLGYDLLSPEFPPGTEGRFNCLAIGTKRLQRITENATGRKLELLTNGHGDYDAKDEDRT